MLGVSLSHRDGGSAPAPALPSPGTYAHAPDKAWEIALTGKYPQAIVLNESRVVFSSFQDGSEQTTVTAVDLVTGDVSWIKHLTRSDCGTQLLVSYAPNARTVACIAVGSGDVQFFDSMDGSLVGEANFGPASVDKQSSGPRLYIDGDEVITCRPERKSTVLESGTATDPAANWSVEIAGQSDGSCNIVPGTSTISANSHEYDWTTVVDRKGSVLYQSFEHSGSAVTDDVLVVSPPHDPGDPGPIASTIKNMDGETLFDMDWKMGFIHEYPKDKDANAITMLITGEGQVRSFPENYRLWDYSAWKLKDGRRAATIVGVIDQTLVVREDDYRLRGLSARNGETRWVRSLDQLFNENTSINDLSMMLKGSRDRFSDGRYLLGYADSQLIALDAETGDVAWSMPVDGDLDRQYADYFLHRRTGDGAVKDQEGAVFTMYHYA
ncbi:PQQ-binding-like beta-propeller repeat protein [Rhodococcus hoagii]|nr:PQQ-binding-like beta-propeller repeat protein [Prescottella equi]MBM4574771.1 PQQ-binding-like beta-propeller repeat protein [Prescottella equi]NKR23571.1 PQQ-binding-like beta-propeller repeat protein [Prescottella equi]